MIRHKNSPVLIRDVYTPLDGPFKRIDFNFKYITNEQLDLTFGTSYADKAVAPLLRYFAVNNGTSYEPEWELSEESKKEISNLVLSYFKFKWEKYIEAMEIEYDPIHNFSDRLKESIIDKGDKEIKTEGSGTQTGNGSKTRTDDLTSTDTKNLSTTTNGTTEDKMQGFNSTSYQAKDNETDNSTVNETGTDTVVNTGTQTVDEQRNFQNSSKESSTINDNNDRKREVERTGNIGNITTQAMLNQEFDLWKRNFIKEVLNDVQSLLTLPIYPS